MKNVTSKWLLGLVAVCGFATSGIAKDSASQDKNVFGTDDRSPITTSNFPWKTIGKLYARGGGSCTGTLVGPQLVLTAAHCVFVDGELANIKFYPNYKNGRASTSANAVHTWWGTNKPGQYRRSDWALLKLDRRLGDTYGWLGTNEYSAAGLVDRFSNLSIAGYSGDFNSGRTAGVHHNCNVHGREGQLVRHDCDTTRGASGGPVLRMLDDKLTIVGITVSERRNGGDDSLYRRYYEHDYANFAIASGSFMDKLRELRAQGL